MSKTKIPSKKRILIFNRDGNKCLWCGRSVVDGIKLNVDHIVSEHFGGSTDFDNLATLCNLCNIGKSEEYFGNYLLSTILKVPNIWSRIETIEKTDPGIGTRYYLILSFYVSDGIGYQKDKIMSDYFIENTLLISEGDSSEICINEIKENALLKFKDIVRDYLLQQRGFFRLLDDKLIFKKFEKIKNI